MQSGHAYNALPLDIRMLPAGFCLSHSTDFHAALGPSTDTTQCPNTLTLNSELESASKHTALVRQETVDPWQVFHLCKARISQPVLSLTPQPAPIPCLPTLTSTLRLLHGLTVRLVCYRRVFDPFKVQLRISQSAGTGSVTSPDTSPAKTNAKPAAKAHISQGQEIRLVVPEIGVVMDSREFEVLTDVISNVGLAQVTCPSYHFHAGM